MTVPPPGPPAHAAMATRRTATATGSPTSGTRPTRSQAPRGCCARTERRPTTGAAIFAYNHSDAYVAEVLAQAAEYRGAFAPGATGGALRALAWAVAHVGRFSGYSQGSSTDRGGSVADMQSREPVGGTCDCSMFARWAMAQAGIDIGSTTVQQWPANGLLPDTETAAATPLVIRGVGADRRPAATGPPT